nr:hypothetical protein CFP56_66957 [Quercus suber]
MKIVRLSFSHHRISSSPLRLRWKYSEFKFLLSQCCIAGTRGGRALKKSLSLTLIITDKSKTIRVFPLHD